MFGSVYSSSSMVEGAIDGGVSCSPQGNGKTYCCASVLDKNGYTTTTYCTTCDDTNPPSNCTPREITMLVVNHGRDLSNTLQSSVLEGATTGQRANITILPSGILQEDNTSSNDDSDNTIALDQSDLVSDTVKKPARTLDDGEEQDESQTTEEPSDQPVDEDEND